MFLLLVNWILNEFVMKSSLQCVFRIFRARNEVSRTFIRTLKPIGELLRKETLIYCFLYLSISFSTHLQISLDYDWDLVFSLISIQFLLLLLYWWCFCHRLLWGSYSTLSLQLKCSPIELHDNLCYFSK